ncbi:MAG: GNAT family N-acetyltransferase [Clostridiales bacterium]|nr:GNAT family N-acetyltransferase [Clostridiales bacterium]
MVKKVKLDELHIVAEMASRVYSSSKEELYDELKESIDKKDTIFFLNYSEDIPVGFAQCKLRYDYVEGTKTSPVGYLEGIFVKQEYRKKGYAKELIAECEQWAKEHGCMEFASDCELDNSASISFHIKSGFTEVNRIVCFKKNLM